MIIINKQGYFDKVRQKQNYYLGALPTVITCLVTSNKS